MRLRLKCFIVGLALLLFNSGIIAQSNTIDYFGKQKPGYYPLEFDNAHLDPIVDYNFSFSPDGNEVYFAGLYNKEYTIKFIEKVDGKWSEKKLASFCNTEKGIGEASPCFSPDGNTLFYISTRSDGFGSWDIWYVRRTDTGWSEPVNAGKSVNSAGFEDYPFLAEDGTFYFNSNRPGGSGDHDIYYTTYYNGQFGRVSNIGEEINSISFDENPVVIGNRLFFGNRAKQALLSSVKINGKWSDPIIISGGRFKPGSYYGLRLTPDGKYFLYGRSGGLEWVDKKALDYLGLLEPPFNYISGWYGGINEQMKLAIHPKLRKRKVNSDADTRETSYDWMINNTAYGKIDDITKGAMNIRLLSQNSRTASVKVVSNHFFDYLQLAKFGDVWKIVNVIWEYHEVKGGGSRAELEQTIQNYIENLVKGDVNKMEGIMHPQFTSRFALTMDSIQEFDKAELLKLLSQNNGFKFRKRSKIEILDIVEKTACARVFRKNNVELLDFSYQHGRWLILNSLRNFKL